VAIVVVVAVPVRAENESLAGEEEQIEEDVELEIVLGYENPFLAIISHPALVTLAVTAVVITSRWEAAPSVA